MPGSSGSSPFPSFEPWSGPLPPKVAEEEERLRRLGELPQTAPATAVGVFTELAGSNLPSERMTATVCIDKLFIADRTAALHLWSQLMADTDADVREAAYTMLLDTDENILTGLSSPNGIQVTPHEASQLARLYYETEQAAHGLASGEPDDGWRQLQTSKQTTVIEQTPSYKRRAEQASIAMGSLIVHKLSDFNARFLLGIFGLAGGSEGSLKERVHYVRQICGVSEAYIRKNYSALLMALAEQTSAWIAAGRPKLPPPNARISKRPPDRKNNKPKRGKK